MERVDYKRHEGIFRVVYLTCSGCCLAVYICQNSNYTPKRVNVTAYNSYFQKKSTSKGLTVKKPKGIFQGDGNALYFDCGYGYVSVYICQNSNYILKVNVFY